MGRRVVATIAGGLLMAMSACSGSGTQVRAVENDGVTALVREHRADGGMDAQIVGELVTGPGGCLALAIDGSAPVAVIWPRGTELLTDGHPGVSVPGVGTVRVGETLEHTGGYVEPSAALPESCGPAAEVAFLND